MNKRAFEKFYQENLDRIYRYVFFRVGRNEHVAQDLVSEIFLKALKHFDTFDPKISRSAWIYRIAHNHLANYYRDQKPTVDLEEISFTVAGDDGRRVMESQEEHLHLAQALKKLSPEDQRLVAMKYIEGYSYKEMSQMLDRASEALKVATHRAIVKLRGFLKT